MTHAETQKQESQRDRDTAALIKLWQHGLTGIPVPDEKQWSLWWKLHHDFEVLAYGLQETCKTFLKRQGILDYDGAVKYASSVMNYYRKGLARRKKSDDFPFHTLSKDLALAVGLPAGMAITPDMFWQCHSRLRAIEAGRVPKPSNVVSADAR